MMTEPEMVEFGNTVRTQLLGDKALEAVADAVCEKLPELAPEHFEAWACILVEGRDEQRAHRDRLQTLNELLVKMPAFKDAIQRFHRWKDPRTAEYQTRSAARRDGNAP